MTNNQTMTNIRTVGRLEVLVVVDNATDSLSTNPHNVQTEWAGLLQNGRMRALSGGQPLFAPGLSLLITLTLAVRSARCCSTLDQEGGNVSP